MIACGPVGPFSGGRLSGEPGPEEVPSWAFAAAEERAQVETRPQDPHSVNTWFAALGADLYVPTSMIRGPESPEERGWVAHVVADPRVRIRLGGLVYERIATRVEEPGEYERARAALEQKYELDPEERDPARQVWIFRMDPRPSAKGPGLAEGAALLAPFKRELQQALREGMAEGTAAAIASCRVRAPLIAEQLSSDRVRVGRTSHRLRNPANAGPAWVTPVLAAYRADASDRAPRLVPLEGGGSGYVEPIVVQPLCLGCHGSDLAPDVAERLAALYPEDRAVGFATGDLRGVFWAELTPAP